MASRHREHLTGYLGSHKAGKAGSSTSSESKQTTSAEPKSGKSQAKDVPVMFSSNVRSRASYLSSRKQPVVKITGKASINHLPDELLLKIFSYLDAGDLLMAARVCKRWLPVAKDSVLWDKIFARYCGPQAASSREVDEVGQRNPAALSKNFYIRSISSSRNKKALRLLKKMSPFTGLPRDTDKALKSAGVYFQLTLIDHYQNEHVLNSKEVFYHQMSATARWYDLEVPKIKTIKEVQIHAINPLFFNNNGTAVSNSPYQRSLLMSHRLDWKKLIQTNKPTGSDDLVHLYSLPDGLMVGIWKGDGELAFVSAGLHCNQLVKRCLLGSSEIPFDIDSHKVIPDDIDSSYGLHDYQCTVEIRTLRNSIWSQQFTCLSCKKENIGTGFAVFPLIRKDYHSDHVILQKKLQFPWKTDAFRGIIENVAWIDVTVLDERNEPFWCISSLTKVAEQSLQKNFDFDYSSEDAYTMSFMDERGKIEAQMSKTDDGNFFMTILNLKLSLDAINTWFGTKYS
ncbi:F-box only protein 15-like [Mercenaria mercenaria]|uniref:F-box only protein 15-like n=1 Tax=Mercenaria mercenaria TaxID=6596 RepID=UPI00234EAABC|nr:F-box only protein 15-like [Mercenaria mercenaria]XP_053401407.1 F-box only protein 15-like [Mercenaria mercenaria]